MYRQEHNIPIDRETFDRLYAEARDDMNLSSHGVPNMISEEDFVEGLWDRYSDPAFHNNVLLEGDHVCGVCSYEDEMIDGRRCASLLVLYGLNTAGSKSYLYDVQGWFSQYLREQGYEAMAMRTYTGSGINKAVKRSNQNHEVTKPDDYIHHGSELVVLELRDATTTEDIE